MQNPPLQVSFVVQALPSLQDPVFGAPAWHVPPPQKSPVVHTLLSLHDAVLLVWKQPVEMLHPSLVHGLLSLHVAVMSVFTHPLEGLHVSAVHTFPSSQVRGAPARHSPSTHPSLIVQALPSSQGMSAGRPLHRPALHVSSIVQTLPSLQATPLLLGPGWQTPPLHESLREHGSPSSHAKVLFVPGWHEPFWQ